jgi:hypothetical protein
MSCDYYSGEYSSDYTHIHTQMRQAERSPSDSTKVHVYTTIEQSLHRDLDEFTVTVTDPRVLDAVFGPNWWWKEKCDANGNLNRAFVVVGTQQVLTPDRGKQFNVTVWLLLRFAVNVLNQTVTVLNMYRDGC